MVWYAQYEGMSLAQFLIGSAPIVIFGAGQEIYERITDWRGKQEKTVR